MSSNKVRIVTVPEPATHSGLSYFLPEHRLDDIVRGYDEIIYSNPTNPNTSTLQFEFSGERNSVVDLRSIHLKLQFKMVKSDNSDIVVTSETVTTDSVTTKVDKINACYANNILHTMFSNYELSLQGKVVASANNMYAQKAFMETELSTPASLKREQGWLKCHGYSFEEDPADVGEGAAFKARKLEIVDSGLVNLYGQLAVDFFGTGNFLLPDIDVRLTLTRSSDSFATIASDPATERGYKIIVTKANLYIHKLALQPTVITSVYRALQQQPAKYNFKECLTKSYLISANHNEFFVDDVFEGAPIRRLVFGITNNLAYTGTDGLNPHKYVDPGLKCVRLIRDGEPVGCTPLFFDDGYVRAYTNTLYALGMKSGGGGNGINIDNFANHFLLAFTLTSDLQTKDEAIRPELVGGRIRIELQFNDGVIRETKRLVVFGEKRSAVFIDKDRNVFKE